MTSLIRVEKGVAAPEELAAIAVVVACFARRNSAYAEPAPEREPRSGNGSRRGRPPPPPRAPRLRLLGGLLGLRLTRTGTGPQPP
ncbi:acyl-CoA carboxylase epsilon subunit [Streptomyces sp. ZAF1911]|uniref:acyl-CoA carboxylase epsilon subunit n=1 Tax=Streptomyces sp. ZAF1911 TaxID=2944129 RepID=UPI00237AD368|nr:acyl-CoA carboxylase epsilon subunit [Streptomyces sp. ZAF1911]MDD9375306.1 acyl-CoA carboxylase epsilon subunit [Streptomyces sp. ZAF1911]